MSSLTTVQLWDNVVGMMTTSHQSQLSVTKGNDATFILIHTVAEFPYQHIQSIAVQ